MRLLRKILSPLALVAAAVGIILAAVIVLTNHDSAGPGIPPESGDEGEGIVVSPGPEASDPARTPSTLPTPKVPVTTPLAGPSAAQVSVAASPTVEPAMAAQAGRTYVVKAGDTPASIALQQLGKASRWQEIAGANPGLEARSLQIGQVLQLPDAGTPSTEAGQGPTAERQSSPPEMSGAPLARHLVEQGDSLYELARQYYGDGSKWTLIRDANPTELGGGVQGMQLGSELVIPARP